MVVRKYRINTPEGPGVYQINYSLPEPEAPRKRGRPKQYDKENREDTRFPAFSLAYMYGGNGWVVVEGVVVFEGGIYSKFRKYQHVRGCTVPSENLKYLEANLETLFKEVRLPKVIMGELEKAFHRNGHKLEATLSSS